MPKKVMITWGPVGGGHQSGMQALSEALVDLDPGVDVRGVNVLSSEVSHFPITAFPHMWPIVAGPMAGLWRAFYFSTNKRSRFEFFERLGQPFGRSGFRKIVQQERPDVIVSVLPYVANTACQVLKDLGWDLPVGIVVLDLVTIHQAWLCRGASWYSLPTEEAWRAVVAKGIDPAKLHICGMPLRKSFWDEPADRLALRQRLGLPDASPVVLMARGADGFGSFDDLVIALLDAEPHPHVVVVTGRNRRLRERLARKVQGRACTVLGYVTNMADWMWASDVLVTKAGPNTIAEAVRCGVPIVLTGAIPGQEEGNVTFVQENGLGLLAKRPQEVVEAVSRILTDPALAETIRGAMKRVHRPRAAHEIARLILESMHEPDRACTIAQT